MKKAFVNDDCIGCGTCCAICPQVFRQDENDKAHATEGDCSQHLDSVLEAAAACPVNAIEVQ